MTAAPRTVVVYSDIACPWASLSVHRLRAHRAALGLDDAIVFDHLAFPLELINGKLPAKQALDLEVAALAVLEPAMGWRPWSRADATYPDTSLPALEAVQAAKAAEVGGLRASEDLDAALRTALYADSRTISLLPVVLDVAKQCSRINVEALESALYRGAGRAEVIAQWRSSEAAQGSPHIFLPDGTDVHNPGIAFSWTGEPGRSFVVIDEDTPSVYDDLLRQAAGDR